MRRMREDDELRVSRVTRSAFWKDLSRSAAGIAFRVPAPADGRALGKLGSGSSGGAGIERNPGRSYAFEVLWLQLPRLVSTSTRGSPASGG